MTKGVFTRMGKIIDRKREPEGGGATHEKEKGKIRVS